MSAGSLRNKVTPISRCGGTRVNTVFTGKIFNYEDRPIKIIKKRGNFSALNIYVEIIGYV